MFVSLSRVMAVKTKGPPCVVKDGNPITRNSSRMSNEVFYNRLRKLELFRKR